MLKLSTDLRARVSQNGLFLWRVSNTFLWTCLHMRATYPICILLFYLITIAITQRITVAVSSKACPALGHSNNGISSSNPAPGSVVIGPVKGICHVHKSPSKCMSASESILNRDRKEKSNSRKRKKEFKRSSCILHRSSVTLQIYSHRQIVIKLSVYVLPLKWQSFTTVWRK